MPKASPADTRSAEEPVAPADSRWTVIRELGVFEFKLAVDGLKDAVLAPLAAIAAVAGFLVGGDRRGEPLRRVIRFGERFERWLNLYGAPRRSTGEGAGLLDEGGSDVLIETVESRLKEMRREIRERPKE